MQDGDIPRADMTQPADLQDRARFLAKAVLVGAAALLVLLIGTFLVVNHANMPEMIIIFWGLFILVAALIAGIAAAYLFLARSQTVGPPPSAPPPALEAAGLISPELEDLAVRLLDGDERRLLRVIVEAKGNILQRDLVRITAFSDAKVSRLLDRLQERGLVVRERQGMSNRVRLTLRQP